MTLTYTYPYSFEVFYDPNKHISIDIEGINSVKNERMGFPSSELSRILELWSFDDM